MRITMSSGEVFSCPVNGWLDNKAPGWPAVGPSSRTVSCARSSGDCMKKNVRLRKGSKHRKVGKYLK